MAAFSSTASAERFSFCCALFLGFLLLMSYCQLNESRAAPWRTQATSRHEQPCDEVYVVGEGETLQTISDKCDDPFILEENLHIQDHDDVYPGLVIKITPSRGKVNYS